MKRPSMQIGLGIVLGAVLGAGMVLVIGSGGLWLAAGIAIGVAVGSAIARRKTIPSGTSTITGSYNRSN
jgi:hypothetical protein